MSTKSVLLLSENFPPAVGGSAVLFDETYRRVDGRHRVWTDPVAAPGPDLESRAPFVVSRVPLATPHWGILSPQGWRHHLRVALRLRREKDCVIHTGRVLPEGIAAWFSRKLGGPRYVTWSHGEDLSTARASRDQALTTKLVLKGASLAIGNSHNTAKQISSYGVPQDRIRVVHPGCDPDRFHPGINGADFRAPLAGPDDFLIATIGRLQMRKGQDHMIKAVAHLKHNGFPNVRYAIGGTGEMDAELRALAKTCNVEDQVHFLGKVPDHDLPRLYAAADAFAMPNRDVGGDFEGFGIVFLEAQAMETPVIAGRSGGAPEAVIEDETALLVDGASVEDIARAIRRLAQDEALCARLGKAGRRNVIENFHWEVAAKKLQAIHEEVAART